MHSHAFAHHFLELWLFLQAIRDGNLEGEEGGHESDWDEEDDEDEDDRFNGLRQWFKRNKERYPNFDINKVVDERMGEEVLLRSTIQREKMTALNYAAFYCKLNIVDFLLKNGAGT